MIVNATPLHAEGIPALTPVTRVSLADLLLGAGGDAATEQALADLLRGHGAVSARVVQTRADGSSVLDFGHARVALRLAHTPAPGELLLISMDHAELRAPGAAEVKLSTLAQLIHDFKKIEYNQIVIEKDATAPMAPMVAADATPEALAQALHHAVRTSGLFYESHLRDWVDGRMPLKDIREEPQARVSEQPAPRGGETRGSEVRDAVHPQLEPLVRQQLDTLERQAFAWRGYVWPDQQAQIVIANDASASADTPRTWRIHLQLNTPTLGPVNADVSLTGHQLALRVQGDAAALNTLRAARESLAQALNAHGLTVSPIQVAAGD